MSCSHCAGCLGAALSTPQVEAVILAGKCDVEKVWMAMHYIL